MKRVIPFLAILFFAVGLCAQTFPTPNFFARSFTRGNNNQNIRGPEGFGDFIVNGKLRLRLADAVRLTVLNNTDVRLDQLQINNATLALKRAYGPFDPVLTASFNPARTTTPTTTVLQAGQTAQVYSSLNQPFQANYSQLFQSGTQYQVTFGLGRSATNSSFATLNPYISTSLQASISQPLLRNRGFLITRAPILIARHNIKQSQAAFEAQVNQLVLTAINDYWNVVQNRENLAVLQQSLQLAEASYKRDKRALELGALPQMDIYRSESQVAQRKLTVIQGETQLKESEDELRRMIGADLDPQAGSIDMELTEAVVPPEMASVDLRKALQDALASRPELRGLQHQVASDDINIRVAENSLRPDVTIGSYYSTNGVGGNQFDAQGNLIPGGVANAFDQLTSLNYPTYGATLQLRLPLRNREGEANLGSSIVSKQQHLYQTRQTEQAIGLQVKNAVHQLDEAKQSVAAAQEARDLSEKNLQAEQRKYELGASQIFFVLDAQNQLSQAEQSLVQAQIGYQRAVASVDSATGALLDKYQVSLVDPNMQP
jgi:outer membrane protein